MRYLALDRGIGRLEDDGSVAVLDHPAALADYLAGGGRLGDLEKVPARERVRPEQVALGPLTRSSAAIWGIGLNYRSKQEATGRTLPEHPVLFLKSPSSVAAPGAPIRIPSEAPDQVDYEGEIAVIVGASLYDATPAEAARAACAITAANDVTARDVMRATRNPSLAKSQPGFGQLGSATTDPSAVGGFDEVTLRTRVNGEEVQTDVGAGMILRIPDLLSLLSRHVVLRPGDVVLTGTPAGTGDEDKTYLVHGDVVEVEVAGLPALRSTVVDGRQARKNGSG